MQVYSALGCHFALYDLLLDRDRWHVPYLFFLYASCWSGRSSVGYTTELDDYIQRKRQQWCCDRTRSTDIIACLLHRHFFILLTSNSVERERKSSKEKKGTIYHHHHLIMFYCCSTAVVVDIYWSGVILVLVYYYYYYRIVIPIHLILLSLLPTLFVSFYLSIDRYTCNDRPTTTILLPSLYTVCFWVFLFWIKITDERFYILGGDELSINQICAVFNPYTIIDLSPFLILTK